MYLLNLHFEPRLDGDNVERFIRAIKFAYPHITWKSGEKIDTPKSISLIRRSAMLGADTHDLFDQLNEASRPIPKRYKPKLNLFFDPPIKTVKEMELFLGTLNAVYPGLEWTSSGPVMNFNPLEDSSTVTGELPWTGEENEHDPIWFLTIGFFPDKPNKLTYTEGDEDSSLSNHEDYGYTWEDGRLWMNHRLPSSDELFDQLNENFQITDNMDLVGLNFTLGNASVIYKVLEKCYNPTIVTNEVEEIGWLVEWPNPLGYISPHGENLRACIGVNQMKRNFELGYYVPTNLPNVDDVFNQLSENTLPYDEPLKVGDKVSLSSESSYFGDGDENPSSEDLIGTIIEINHRNTLPIDVEWEERGWKYYNSYRESDLIFRGNRYNYDETSNLFNQLDESVEDDDLDWVKNIIDEMPIRVGDVFYVVDDNPEQHKPDDYKPRDVRFVLTVADIFPTERDTSRFNFKEELLIKYKPCDPKNVTYNPKDYTLDSPKCYDYEDTDPDDADEEGYEYVEMSWFLKNLYHIKYWRPMGNSL